MNKLELIQALKEKTGITKQESAQIVDLFFDAMADSLVEGDRIEIRGLFSFYVKHYPAYSGRNPKTGKMVEVAAKKMPFFKCGQELRKRMNKEDE